MARNANADITVFNMGATDYLAWLKSANFDWDITLEACAGIAERYEPAVETKRALTFSASMNRKATSGASCQTAKTVTTLSLGGTSYLASWESLDISVTNNHSRSDAGGDYLATMQLHRPTNISGSITIMTDSGTATLISSLISSGTAVAATFSFIDGVGTFTAATYFKKVTKQWQEAGLIMLTIQFEKGTISSGGGGLFATASTGTGAIAYTATDGSENIQGNAVILSARLRAQRDGRTTEDYEFHCNSVAAS